MRTMTKRFYVSNHPIDEEHRLMTYQEACEKAALRITADGRASTAIIEVVAIVSRKETPVIIEKIRR